MPDRPLDSEINLRGIVIVAVVLIAVTVTATALMWWVSLELRTRMAADDPAPAALLEARAQQTPSGPLLQSDPIGELASMRQEEAAVLDHAAWVDEASATIRLPIDTALDIVAANGKLPDLNPRPGSVEDDS